MVLNNKPQMFTIGFPSDFFYPEVVDKWKTIITRMRLPYESVTDFMNAQIQSVTFPSVNFDTVTQQRGQYEVAYRTGKELEPLIDKSLRITFKLTESYVSYWILWDQCDLYLHYASFISPVKPVWMEPISLMFISDSGHELTGFKFKEITPTGLSELNLSYAATVASYNTFTWNIKYNVFEIE